MYNWYVKDEFYAIWYGIWISLTLIKSIQQIFIVKLKFFTIFGCLTYLIIRNNSLRQLQDLFYIMVVGVFLVIEFYQEYLIKSRLIKKNENGKFGKKTFYKTCLQMVPQAIALISQNKKKQQLYFHNQQVLNILNCEAKDIIDKISQIMVKEGETVQVQKMNLSDKSINNSDQVQNNNTNLNIINNNILTTNCNNLIGNNNKDHCKNNSINIDLNQKVTSQNLKQKSNNLPNKSNLFFKKSYQVLNFTTNQNIQQCINLQQIQTMISCNQAMKSKQNLCRKESIIIESDKEQNVVNKIQNVKYQTEMSRQKCISYIGNISGLKNIQDQQNKFQDLDIIQNNDSNDQQFKVIQFKSKINDKTYLVQMQHVLIQDSFAGSNEYGWLIILQDYSSEDMIQNLQNINEIQIQHFSQVTHEMRTPLNCTTQMLENLYSQVDTELQIQYLRPVIVSMKILSNMVNDILDFSQIRAQKFSFYFQKVNIIQIINQTVQLMQIQAQAKTIKLNTSFSKNLPKHFGTDPHRFRQILLNLIGNALKFTKEFGEILVSANLVDNVNKNQIQISIKDSGIGIPPEHQDKLFKTFGKVNTSESCQLNQQGCGLGLIISNSLALGLGPLESKQGLHFTSDYGKGTTFTFMIIDKCEQNEASENIEDEESDQVQPNDSVIQLNKNIDFVERQQSAYQLDKKLPSMFQTQNSFSYLTSIAIDSQMQTTQFLRNSSFKQPFSAQYTQDSFLNNDVSMTQLEPLQKQVENRRKPLQDINEIIEDNLENLSDLSISEQCSCYQILIVDDNVFNSMALCQTLKQFKIIAQSTLTGEKAINLVKERNNNYCCQAKTQNYYKAIFLDIDLPDMDGYQILDVLQKNDVKMNTSTKYIACTGYTSLEEQEKCIKNGFSYYLEKPVNRTKLQKILREIF